MFRVAQVVLDLLILFHSLPIAKITGVYHHALDHGNILPLPPQCWNDKDVPPCLAPTYANKRGEV